MAEIRLFDAAGKRLYLTENERTNFLEVARTKRPEVRTLAETLVFTGC